jgi:hypothetical protein
VDSLRSTSLARRLAEAGIDATDEQIDAVAGDVEIAHQNYGMAHGYDAIPNPREAEVERLKDQIRQLERERDIVCLNFKKNVARRRRCDVIDVELGEDGHATIHG